MNIPSLICLLIGLGLHGQFFYGYKRFRNKTYFKFSIIISVITALIGLLISNAELLINQKSIISSSIFLFIPLISISCYYLFRLIHISIYNKEPKQMYYGNSGKGFNNGDFFYTIATFLLPIFIPILLSKLLFIH